MPKNRNDINGLTDKKSVIEGKATGKENKVEWKTVKREAHIKIIKPDLTKEKYMQRTGDQST